MRRDIYTIETRKREENRYGRREERMVINLL